MVSRNEIEDNLTDAGIRAIGQAGNREVAGHCREGDDRGILRIEAEGSEHFQITAIPVEGFKSDRKSVV